MRITLKDLSALQSVEIVNGGGLKNKNITGISIDSRTIEPGNIFVALRGEKFDGHQFVDEVFKKGAAAVMVDEAWRRTNNPLATSPANTLAIVPDTTKAFGELAKMYRRRFSIPVLAVGGSNGKTTTKEMISAVLRTTYSVLSTEGNLNNHIGVPKMLFRLTPKHDIAVLELGTNHFGELKYLCEIAEPTHAILTNVAREHLEYFGDETGVAREETELFRSLPPKGFAFVNVDDNHLLKAGAKIRRSAKYGVSRKAGVRALNVHLDERGCSEFDLGVKGKKSRLHLSTPGLHNVSNALAAAAVGLTFKVPKKKIISALESFKGANRRMEIIKRNSITILNDTYNANPDSVLAALQTLKSMKVEGKKIVVLADMLELGSRAEHEHARLGLAVSDLEFEYLLTFGPLSRFTHEASKLAFAEYFDSKDALIASLKSLIAPGDAVLVKGSRGMKMEEVVDKI